MHQILLIYKISLQLKNTVNILSLLPSMNLVYFLLINPSIIPMHNIILRTYSKLFI